MQNIRAEKKETTNEKCQKPASFVCCFYFYSFARIFDYGPTRRCSCPESQFFLCERSMVNWPVLWLRLSTTSPEEPHLSPTRSPSRSDPHLLHDSWAWVTRLCQFFGTLPLISGFRGACLLSVSRVPESQSYSTQRLLTAPGKGRIGEIPMDSKCFINFKTLHFNFK